MQQSEQVIVILVTTGSQQEAQDIAIALVENKLAACVNRFEIHSTYRWEGSVQQEAEWQLVIKTCPDKYKAIEQFIQSQHSYDVPEIIALPIVKGYAPYLSWIGQSTSPIEYEI